MCLLCIEIQKGNINEDDVVRNFNELSLTDPKHAEEVIEKHGDKLIRKFMEIEDEDVSTPDWFFYHMFSD